MFLLLLFLCFLHLFVWLCRSFVVCCVSFAGVSFFLCVFLCVCPPFCVLVSFFVGALCVIVFVDVVILGGSLFVVVCFVCLLLCLVSFVGVS